MTGHLHLAAALAGEDLTQFDSPLHLYNSRESLIRGLLSLHQMTVSLETFESIAHHYFMGSGACLNIDRFSSMLKTYNPLIIDPSFSHAMNSGFIRRFPDLGVECNLLVLWRNPINFSLDLMQGIYGFDCCLQWILANSLLSFPLDPLMLWLEFVRPYLELVRQPPSVFKHILHFPREKIFPNTVSRLCSFLSAAYSPGLRPSFLSQVTSLFSECPYSGDPSYIIEACGPRSMVISIEQLARFSNQDQVIQEVIESARSIGYVVNPQPEV